MDKLRKTSRKIKATLSGSFENLVEKARVMAQHRFSPNSFKKHSEALDDLKRKFEDSKLPSREFVTLLGYLQCVGCMKLKMSWTSFGPNLRRLKLRGTRPGVS